VYNKGCELTDLQQQLIYNKTFLNDEMYVKECNFNQNSAIYMTNSYINSIFIENQNGFIYNIELQNENTDLYVQELKYLIKNQVNDYLQVNGQKLIYNGVELEDASKLNKYGKIYNDFVMMEFTMVEKPPNMINVNITNWHNKKHISSYEFNTEDIIYIIKKYIFS